MRQGSCWNKQTEDSQWVSIQPTRVLFERYADLLGEQGDELGGEDAQNLRVRVRNNTGSVCSRNDVRRCRLPDNPGRAHYQRVETGADA
jgi:hypothetical protein